MKGIVALLGAATIWGVSFVAQSAGMNYMSAYTFNFLRFLLGAVTLLPVLAIQCLGEARRGKTKATTASTANLRRLLISSLLCGCLLFSGSILQQIGLQYTAAGKAGFITSFYIVLIPVIEFVRHKSLQIGPLVAAFVGLTGLFLLCVTRRTGVNVGDLYVLIGAFCFTEYIMAVDHFGGSLRALQFSFLQFLVSAALSAIFVLVDGGGLPALGLRGLLSVAYAGILGCGAAYTLQVVGQSRLAPIPASFILSLESCISAVAGWVLLGQSLTTRELIGCLLVFVAITITNVNGHGDLGATENRA